MEMLSSTTKEEAMEDNSTPVQPGVSEEQSHTLPTLTSSESSESQEWWRARMTRQQVQEVEPDRDRAAYRYRDKNLVVIHHTSVPWDDDEAFDYAELIRTWGIGVPRFVEALDFGGEAYQGLGEIEYDDEIAAST